ncbi:MAG: hypothetical protein PHG67_09435 [Bacteroidales bacterium]|jgi:hypothetical protein|nr:hypothetical protein [Bacteroidales bacterium]
MNISSGKEKGTKSSISLLAKDFYAAIRVYDAFVQKKSMGVDDDKLEATCQVVGYEIIKHAYDERMPSMLAVDLEINDIGTAVYFYFDTDTFALVKAAAFESGYFKSKLEYFCDEYVVDQNNQMFNCYFDTKSLNKQLSTDRVLTLRKYLKTSTITIQNFHDSI